MPLRSVLRTLLFLSLLALACRSDTDWKVHNERGSQAFDAHRFADAARDWEHALAHAERHGPEHRIATSMNNLGLAYEALGRFEDAERLLRRSIEIDQRIHGADTPETVTTLLNLAALHEVRGDFADAEPLYAQALRILDRHEPESPVRGETLRNLSDLYRQLGRYEEAARSLKGALAFEVRVLGQEHEQVAMTTGALASMLHELGRYSEAEQTYRDAIRIARAVGARPQTATIQNRFAELLETLDRTREAGALFRESAAIVEEHYGADSLTLAGSLQHLSRFAVANGEPEQAAAYGRRALSIQEQAFGPNHPNLAGALHALAFALEDLGQHAEAEALYRRCLAIEEHNFGPRHVEVATTMRNLGRLLCAAGRPDEALAITEEARAIHVEVLGEGHPNVARYLFELGRICAARHQYAEAETHFRRAIARDERALGQNHPEVAATLYALGSLLNECDRSEEALPLLQRAVRIEEAAHGRGHDLAETLELLAETFEALEDHGEADFHRDRARQVRLSLGRR